MGLALERSPRWELYRLLGEPFRLRLLALTAQEELTIGELAEITQEPQPNVSRHLKLLREAGLVSVRRQGTRALARLTQHLTSDPLVSDAIESGRELCEDDGSLARIVEVMEARDAHGRRFFERPAFADPSTPRAELLAYLTALKPLLRQHRLAVDVGTGDGAFLDLLAPLFDRVVAVDRAQAQLELAKALCGARGYDHVELLRAHYEDSKLANRVRELGGADAVFAARLLHHAPRPQQAVSLLGSFARPGGYVVIIDYRSHDDEDMRERQADLWLGFEKKELVGFARSAGLADPQVFVIPAARYGPGPDAHLQWQVLAARRVPTQETQLS